MIPHFWPGLTAGLAVLAALLWLKSATVTVPAPADTAGVGALIGGYLISLDKKGQRIDLHETLKKQSSWSAYAAIAAAASAVCSGLAIFYP
ncbi:hypothetical protein XH79_18170 [Bradyrhizobium sp. CCBAU 45389]|nr:hypothetical protein [Bradyrhizobium sp. CCBAU 45389]